MKIQHDIHVHTNLSSCSSDPEQTPENILKKAAELGIRTVGFADHLWCRNIPGASDWYKPQDELHVLKIREQMPADCHGVKTLVGCESEFTGTACGIDRQHAALFDFVLIPCSHFHMLDFVRPKEITSAEGLAKLLLEHWSAVLDLDVATGIAHPFHVIGGDAIMDNICRHLRRSEQLRYCLDKSAAKQVSIEINASYFPQLFGRAEAGFHDESIFVLLEQTRRSGCLFHFASDAHELKNFGSTLQMQDIADQLCLRDDDIHPLFR